MSSIWDRKDCRVAQILCFNDSKLAPEVIIPEFKKKIDNITQFEMYKVSNPQ